MCGIVGFLKSGSVGSIKDDECILKLMSKKLLHRGPDSDGIWIDSSSKIFLGHRRLSVVDTSPAGSQPMQSLSGRFVISYNGEIYNHKETRAMLGRNNWRSQSDTETLLEAFEEWGIEKTLRQTVGMFAFALWDRNTKQLTLARDRLGEKPLYYGWQRHKDSATFLFGSELKSLRAHPAFVSEVNRDAIHLLMRHNYIPAPHSIYKGIYKLQPGTFLTVSMDQREPVIRTYWSLADVAITGNNNPFRGTPDEAVDRLDVLLKAAVRLQMVADVPFGAFLSGGIDSSTVAALMQAQSAQPVKTFTIGFEEVNYNEAIHAKNVARHLGTDHTELYVTPQQALDVIANLPKIYCEPFSDSSQIPTFLVSQLARKKVTVSLSGDAGDELFAGYNRYILTNNLWRYLSRIKPEMRLVLANAIRFFSPTTLNNFFAPWQSLAPRWLRQSNLGDKLHKGSEVLGSNTIDELYLKLVTHWQPHELVQGGSEPETYLGGNSPRLDGLSGVQRMMARDAMTYLPDDNLCKIDRAAMAVSLESRVPFLDHRVVEFAWRIPQELKIRDGVRKWVLRQVLYRYVPKKLIERPKMGFGVPIDTWLRGPLRAWAEELLDERRLRQEGYFNPSPVRQKWAEHLSGKRNWQYHLWDVLMFQSWLECWKK